MELIEQSKQYSRDVIRSFIILRHTFWRTISLKHFNYLWAERKSWFAVTSTKVRFSSCLKNRVCKSVYVGSY